jgi:hypothetical protein
MPKHGKPRPLNFKERMKGHVAFDDHVKHLTRPPNDDTGWVLMSLEFRMHVDDVPSFWEKNHIGTMEGEIFCEELGGKLPIEDGRFQLMIPVGGNPQHKHMLYHARFRDEHHNELTLNGYKEVITGEFGPLEDTTAMLTRIYAGSIGDSERTSTDSIATGVLRISIVDVVTQLFTFRSDGNPLRALGTIGMFIWHFNAQVADTYVFARFRRQKPPA